MRLDGPIALLGDTKCDEPGLTLLAAQPGMPWQTMHAVIALPAETNEATRHLLLRALAVHQVGETDQAGASGKVLRAPLLGEAFRAAGTLAIAELRFDLREVLGDEAAPDPAVWLHLGAQATLSAPKRIPTTPSALTKVLARTPQQQLQLAYALAREGNPAEALERMRAPLEREDVRADLDRPHLYNAACLCGRLAAATTDKTTRDKLLKQAMAWLDLDQELAAARHAQIRQRLARTPVEPERARLLAQRALLDAHLDARATDPDLAPLQTLPGWRAA